MKPYYEPASARASRKPDVVYWNATLGKRYPVTVDDKGWIYGVWYCGTAWAPVMLHGQYPPTFLKRALALFPDVCPSRLLQVPSGTLKGPGVTIDLVSDKLRSPQLKADASQMPFRDGSFDLILADPPYTAKDAKKYGTPPFRMGRFVKECHRVLAVGGHLGVLHTYFPMTARKDWALVGLIAVVTSFQRATRIFSIFRKLAPSPQAVLL